GNRYSVTAKVKSVRANQNWWYDACTICKRKTHPNGDKCSDSLCAGQGAEPRYLISFVAVDPDEQENDAASVEFVCFGPTAEMIGVPDLSLIESTAGGHCHPPSQITRLCGKDSLIHLFICHKLITPSSSAEGSSSDSTTKVPVAESSAAAAARSPTKEEMTQEQTHDGEAPEVVLTPPTTQTPAAAPIKERRVTPTENKSEGNANVYTSEKRSRKEKTARKLYMDSVKAGN
ncbi:hypothetical protein EJB05_44415, partial [Eragrostis curvula]